MHIAHVSYFYDEHLPTVEAALERYWPTVELAETLAGVGHQVSVFQRFHTESAFSQNGVDFFFCKDRWPGRLDAWQLPLAYHRQIARSDADLIHLHGVQQALQCWSLRRLLPSKTRMVMQDHGALPPSFPSPHLQRVLLGDIDLFLFAADELGDAWVQSGTISSAAKVVKVMEGSTRIRRADVERSRAITGMRGDPAFLWVGRLNDNKDPVAVLRGFSATLDKIPNASLHMVYTESELLEDLTKLVHENPALESAVSFVGRVELTDMVWYYSSADFFILGSHKEGSGFALLEALACGLTPVVTDIPSFREITGASTSRPVGELWTAGDTQACRDAILRAVDSRRADDPERIRDHFERRFSYPALEREMTDLYRAVLANAKRDHP